MVLVIGNSPKRVFLKDLDDYVYYKQKKIFSEAQYNMSRDLKEEIKKGSLTVLQRTIIKNAEFEAPEALDVVEASARLRSPQEKVEDPRIGDLLAKIANLEKMLGEKPSPATDSDAIKALSDRIEGLENGLSGLGGATHDSASMGHFTEALERLEKKIEAKSAGDDIIQRLEGLLTKAGTVQTSDQHEPVRPEDIYVPNVKVEDANSHINLKVRTVETSDDVTGALDALKKLRNAQK